jgi:hypothetical protein
MTGYQAPLLDWLDYVLSSDTLMGEAEGYRTMFFTDLEIGLHNDPGSTDEHMAAKGSCLCNLNEFYNVISSITTPTEADVIRALSSITGVDESDFFDFYTVGGWRPSASEIQDWLSSQNN